MSQTYMVIGGAFIVIILLAFIFYSKHKKAQAKAWEEANPSGSKIYFVSKSFTAKFGTIMIHQVDGSKPVSLYQARKTGIYISPGNHVIEATYTSTRPGIIYRRVTTTYGPVRMQVEIGPNREYQLSFDKKNKRFEFEEV